MKVLLDECITKRLKPFLKEHLFFKVTEMKGKGLRNGNLMLAAIEEKFDMLLTIDKNLSFQQNMKRYDIIVVVFNSSSSNIKDVQKHIPEFETQLKGFEKGKAYIV